MGAMSDVLTTVAESSSKKLRIKVLAKKPVNEACEVAQAIVGNSVKKQPSVDVRSKALTVERKLESNQGIKRVTGCLGKFPVSQNQTMPAVGNAKFESVSGSKRSSEEVLEGRARKRLKMDRLATFSCQRVLSKLMKNKLGFPFCVPVNPDAWGGIDDYFDIIKHPMDLGTIQKKLQKKTYTHVEEFEADVRLTFSNAMLYNPPDNWVHKSAKELDMMFTSLWKFDKTRIGVEHKDIKHHVETKQSGLMSSYDKITYDKISKPDGEHKDMKEQVDIIKQRGPAKLTSNGKNNCSVRLASQAAPLPRKTMPPKERSSEASKKVSVEGQQLRDLINVKPQDVKPQDVKPQDVNPQDVKHQDVNPQDVKPQERASFNELDCTTFPSTTGFSGATAQVLETMDVDVSPSKALRVARLKSRFADTILKAKHQRLLETGVKTESANWLQEKLILERRQQEEKARIEAQLRAVQSAARLKVESELKQQREAQRKASRLALEKMKQSVEFEDNLRVLRDLEAMVGSSLVVVCHDHRSHSTVWSQIGRKQLSPLQRLGLFIKKEYMVGDDDDDYGDYEVEEGEVV